jgi:hypothetical protein
MPVILACHEAGVTVTLPKPLTSGAKSDGPFSKQDFAFCQRMPPTAVQLGRDCSIATQMKKTARRCGVNVERQSNIRSAR